MPLEGYDPSAGSSTPLRRPASGGHERGGLRLALLRMGNIQAVFPISDAAVTIGRDMTNGIVIHDPRASKCHTEVTWYGNELLVQDLDSLNGTRVNERKVKTHVLRHGDLLRVGRSVFLCLAMQSADGGLAVETPRMRDFHGAVGWLVGRAPKGKPIRMPVTEVPMLIGGAEEADIHVPDEEIAEFHAQIIALPNAVQLTRINLDVPKCAVLSDGDELRFGSVRLKYRVTVLPEPISPATPAIPSERSARKPTSVPILPEPDDIGLLGTLEAESNRLDQEPSATADSSSGEHLGRSVAPYRGGGCVLTATCGPCKGKSFAAMDKPLTIGSDKGCDVRIDDEGVSPRHARIERVAGDAVIEDLGGKNGVFVNGKRVRRRPLRPGARIRIGLTEFLVHL